MLFKRYKCGQNCWQNLERYLSGFSLLELLCVLSVVSVLMVMGVSGYQGFVGSQRLSLYVNQISRAIRYAQHQAIMRASDIIFCGSHDQQHCDGDWQQGQIILQGSQVLKHFSGLDRAYSIRWRGSWGQTMMLELNDRGVVAAPGSFYIAHGQKRCRIILNQMTRIRVICT